MLQVLAPDNAFRIAKQRLEKATTGFIVSHSTDSRAMAAAVSGWEANPARGTNVLDNTKYTALVQDVARFLGFKLARARHDNNGKILPEHRGRFVASHVVSNQKLVTSSVDVLGMLTDSTGEETFGFLDYRRSLRSTRHDGLQADGETSERTCARRIQGSDHLSGPWAVF